MKNKKANLADLLLDSSLILTTTNDKEVYNYKVIDCNNYIQLYKFEEKKVKKDKNLEKQNIKNIDTDFLYKDKNNKEKNKNNIELKNIMRSKLECQRLAKCNADEWKTFITLTFANFKELKIGKKKLFYWLPPNMVMPIEYILLKSNNHINISNKLEFNKKIENYTSISKANKKFRYFIDKVQRVYKDLKYICIPEFQQNGTVHYHLLSNIDINNKNLIYKQIDNPKFLHIKYWNEGYNKVDILDSDIKKIIGYISKYMTKDIDNRLFNCHRYFFSRNLLRPKTSYIDLNNYQHLEFLNRLLKNKELIYQNDYINSYDNDLIKFEEYLKQ